MKNINSKKMIIVIGAVMTMIGLSGCEKETKDVSQDYNLPEGLQDCKIYKMNNTIGNSITVVRCPLSSTTNYTNGKSTANATVVEQAPSQVAEQKTENKTEEVEINSETYTKKEKSK